MNIQPASPNVDPQKVDSRNQTSSAPARVLVASTLRLPSIALLGLDLAMAGCEISAVCPARHPILKTRVLHRTFPYSGIRPLTSLTAAINASNPQIIVPGDDRVVEHLQELYVWAHDAGAPQKNLKALIETSLGSPASHSIVRSRAEFHRVARELGLRVPVTRPINSINDLIAWQAQQPLPWVLKADGTFGGHGVKIAQSFDQAVQFVSDLGRSYCGPRAVKRFLINRDEFWLRPWWRGIKPAITVQSYIQGRPANCAVMSWRGKVLAGIGVEVVSADGPTGPASAVRVVENQDMMFSANRIAEHLRLSGFFGLDFMIEESSGHSYLIEINPRPTRLSRLQLGPGRDMVGALCAQLEGRPPRNLPPVTQNPLISYYPAALDCKYELLRSSFSDVQELNPDLMQELRQPWPTMTLSWRLADLLGRLKEFRPDSPVPRGRGQEAAPELTAPSALNETAGGPNHQSLKISR